MKHTVDTVEVESGWMALKGHDPNRRMVKGTLVIGEERVFTESEVRAIIARLPVQAMVGTPCVILEDIAPTFGLSDPT